MALLSCPECKQQISDQATVCIHCGYPSKTTVQSKSKITQDIEDIKTVGAWLAFFITLPTLAVPAVISTLLDNPGQFDEEAIKILWETFLLTAPLTCAIALIGVWITPIIEKYSSPTYSVMSGIGIGALFSLWLAAQISQSLLNIQGVDIVTTISSTNASGPLKIWMSLWNIFVEYFRLYGFQKFLSSCAIGIFLGWIWNSKILPYFRIR
jgi:hypothetical protein